MITTALMHDGSEKSAALEILRRLGHEVIARQNATSIVSLLSDSVPIDLVILDCHTNGMDFLDVLDALKKLAPHVPCIMLTENGSIETYLQACNLGVFEYMNKPVKALEIIRIVNTALTKAQKQGARRPHHQGAVGYVRTCPG